jgi:hypothetical protein
LTGSKLHHTPSDTTLTVGSIDDTLMDNFILARVPNPNIEGKSIAEFREYEVTDVARTKVSTMEFREDEDTYLPFYGINVRGRGRVVGDMMWETMYSKLPFGANPTALQIPGMLPVPPVNNITMPYLWSANGTWTFGPRRNGIFKLNFLYVGEDVDPAAPGVVPNIGNYWFWTDPLVYLTEPAAARPMRDIYAITQQSQISAGASVQYLFPDSNIRSLLAYGFSNYKPNVLSDYKASGVHYRGGIGWTDRRNTVDLDLEYIHTNPYYNAFQLYFPPIGNLPVGGLPLGSPVGFHVLPTYYGGLPGAYIPFGYQLHDSGLFPNNRQGFRLNSEYRFLNNRGRFNLRGALLEQVEASVPHISTSGQYQGLPPGFIDPIFHPLYTDGATVPEAPKGRVAHIGGAVSYRFTPSRLTASLAYDTFSFNRDSDALVTTQQALRNVVDLNYNIGRFGVAYQTSSDFTLKGGYDFATIRGYHPTIRTLVLGDAGQDILNVTQHTPYLGFDYNLTATSTWGFVARYIDVRDSLADTVSPESFKGWQLMTDYRIKF